MNVAFEGKGCRKDDATKGFRLVTFRAEELVVGEDRQMKVRTLNERAAEIGIDKVAVRQIGIAKIRVAKIDESHIRIVEISTSKIGVTKVGTNQS